MNEKTLRTLIKNYHPVTPKQREYALMIPVLENKAELQLLFEVRSQQLQTQPGEIAFPGGRIEPLETPQQAAERETCEELCLPPEHLEIWGNLGSIPPSFNRRIHLYIGKITTSLELIQPNKAEVSALFAVPLTFFLEHQPQVYEVKVSTQPPQDFPYQLIPNGKNYKWPQITYPVPFYLYQEHIIWGLTARCIMRLVSVIESHSH